MALEELKELSKSRYVGDGVYLSFDGFHINIAVNAHNNHAVSLDPEVCDNLIEYIKNIRELYTM